MNLPSADSIGPYRILRELGAGATARVLEAEHRELRKRVAIKLLFPRGPTSVARFLREGQAAARVRHPHVVDIFDVGTCDQGPYLVMELVGGGTLASRVPRPQEADVATAMAWLLPVISAVQAAHDVGVIHRDLKPSNLLVAFDAQGGVVPKVADFGLSKLSEDPGELTCSEGLLGTPAFMAPEQMLDPRSVGPAADQYSIGVLLHLFTTGALPYDAASPLALMNLVVTGDLAPICVRAPWVPAALAEVLSRALSVEPRARFPSLRALGEALLPFASERTQILWRNEWPVEPGLPRAVLPRPPSPAGETGDTFDDRAPELPSRSVAAPSVPGAVPERRRPWRWGLGLLALAGLLGLGLRYSGARNPPLASRDFWANASQPRGKSRDAERAYRLGLTAMRGSAWEVAVEQFERAVSLDPSHGAAQLRLAMAVASPEPQARRALAQARVLRDELSERDRVFLDSMEVIYFHAPPDHSAQVAILREGVRRFPDDAELKMHLAISLQGGATWAEAEQLATQVLAQEPAYPDALQVKARARAALGDPGGALRELERCAEMAPLAIGCLRALVNLHAAEGRCEALPPLLRRWSNVDPRAFEPQILLAGVLAREEKPWQATEEALRQRWSRSSPEERPLREIKDRIRLALHRAQWTEALALLEKLFQLPAEQRDEETDDWVADHLLFALEASDQRASVARVAKEYLARAEARPRPQSLEENVRLRALFAAFRVGDLSAEEALPRAQALVSDSDAGKVLVSALFAGAAGDVAPALNLAKSHQVSLPPSFRPLLAALLARAEYQAEARVMLETTLRGCDGLALPFLTARRALAQLPPR